MGEPRGRSEWKIEGGVAEEVDPGLESGLTHLTTSPYLFPYQEGQTSPRPAPPLRIPSLTTDYLSPIVFLPI